MDIKAIEKELLFKYKENKDPEIKRQLIFSLTPLIRGQVKKYTNSGLPYEALELEGKRLVGEAIEGYDPSFNVQLNTYATNHLRKLSRYTNQYQNVGQIPEPRALMIGKYETIFSNLESEKGREPTVAELSDAMQVSQREIERLQSERRNDLHMELPASDSSEGGFSYYIMPDIEDPKVREAVEFVYFDSSPVNKKIMEYTFGLGGTQKISSKDMKLKLSLTETELKKRKTEIANNIKSMI